MVDTESFLMIDFDQRLDQTCPLAIHNRRFQPALGSYGIDDDDLGAVFFLEAFCNSDGDLAGCKILALSVNIVFRACDQVEIKILDFGNGRPVVAFRLGPRNRDVDIFEIGF